MMMGQTPRKRLWGECGKIGTFRFFYMFQSTDAYAMVRIFPGEHVSNKAKSFPMRKVLCFLSLMAAWASFSCAFAADVGLAGVFPGKALLTINGGAPRTVAVGSKTEEGVKVLSIDGDTATVEIEGQRRVLRVGQNVAAQPSGRGPETVTLKADSRGHFITTGSINGASVRFMVDTGATTIGLGVSDARRIGIDFTRGERIRTTTANGVIEIMRVKLDSVRLGDVVLHNVEAGVGPDMPFVLLGMSFLNRMEMQRNGDTMILKKRY